jgi:hypothetical protein
MMLDRVEAENIEGLRPLLLIGLYLVLTQSYVHLGLTTVKGAN